MSCHITPQQSLSGIEDEPPPQLDPPPSKQNSSVVSKEAWPAAEGEIPREQDSNQVIICKPTLRISQKTLKFPFLLDKTLNFD